MQFSLITTRFNVLIINQLIIIQYSIYPQCYVF